MCPSAIAAYADRARGRYDAGTGSPRPVCEICGGSLRRDNRWGICTREPECAAEVARRRSRDWNVRYAEKHRERARDWQQRNPERATERKRAWTEANRERLNEARRQNYADNPERRRAKALKDRRERRERLAAALIEWEPIEPEASRCYVCGRAFSERRARHLDHVVPIALANWTAFETGLTLSGLRPACHSCNTSKRDREHSAFILGRWARGLPVRQAVTVEHVAQ